MDEVKRIHNSAIEITNNIEVISQEMQRLYNENDMLKKENNALKKEITALQENAEDSTQEIEGLQGTLANMQTKIAKLEDKIKELHQEREERMTTGQWIYNLIQTPTEKEETTISPKLNENDKKEINSNEKSEKRDEPIPPSPDIAHPARPSCPPSPISPIPRPRAGSSLGTSIDMKRIYTAAPPPPPRPKSRVLKKEPPSPAAQESSDPELPLNKTFSSDEESENERIVGSSSIILLGGRKKAANNYTNLSVDNIYVYDVRYETFKQIHLKLPELEMGTALSPIQQKEEEEWTQLGMAVLKNDIYIFGGTKFTRVLKCCYKLEADGSWKKMADMNEERSHISSSCVVFRDKIWVMGGIDSKGNSLKSVERYNPVKNEWTKMPDLRFERNSAAAAVCKGKIYISGGSSERNSVLNSVEVFDLKLKTWQGFSKLPSEMKTHCMVLFVSSGTEYLCAIGERDESFYMNMNENEKEWKTYTQHNQNRRNFGAVALNSQIVIFGGFILEKGRASRLDSVEVYDGEEWNNLPNLPDAISGFGYSLIPQEVTECLLQKFS